jgi:hypothetical protein
MKKKVRIGIFMSLILSILFILINGCKKDLTTQNTGSIKGSITNEFGQPVEGAKIEIGAKSALSNYNGFYWISKLAPEKYTVSVFKDTYLSQNKSISILNNDTVSLDFSLVAGVISLSVSDSVLNLSAKASLSIIDVTSNSGWVIDCSSNWITVNKLSGQGNGSFDISLTDNIDDKTRTGTVSVKAGNVVKTINISQSSGIKLISYSGIPGNLITNIPDSIELVFNKNIKVLLIKSVLETCLSEINYGISENISVFHFSYSCSELGGAYTFIFEVSDNEGNKLIDTLKVPFYSEKVVLKGEIIKTILDDENNLWVSTINRHPVQNNACRIYKFSTSGNTIKQELSFDLNIENKNQFNFGDFFINPYNNLIYFSDYEGKKIDVYDLTGNLKKSIVVTPDSLDIPLYPLIYPTSVGFNKAGLGWISLANPDMSGSRGKLINSTDNDIITIPDASIDIGTGLLTFNLNFDKATLFLQADRGFFINMYDATGIIKKINILDFYSSADVVSLTPNKLNNKVYVDGLYNQQIISIDGSYHSNQSYSQGLLADFSYDPSRSNQVYTLTPDNLAYLELDDYDKQITYYTHSVISSFSWSNRRNILTTTDNRYIILTSDYVNQQNEESQIVFIKINKLKI